MAESVAVILVRLVYAYAIVGIVFAIAFVILGVQKIDHRAKSSSWGFRLVILPGVAGLWPLVLTRWIRATGEPPLEREPHQ